MTRVVAIILHAVPGATGGVLEAEFARARATNAARLARDLSAAGAATTIAEVVAGGAPFGARLREARRANPEAGLVILGSGSVPLARPADLRAFVAAAGTDGPVLANNRYSADIVAIPATVPLDGLADVAADNGLPRWFAEHGSRVADLASRWRLQVDLDSPLDGFLAGIAGTDDVFARVRQAREGFRRVAQDPAAEIVIAGRTSSGALRWLEHHTAGRTRALVEERGLRTARPGQRPPRSVLGLLLERDGARKLGTILAGLGDAAVIDSRVLLAHRLGSDEAAWSAPEDRFASDLLLHEQIADTWLRDLTRAAADAPMPVLLGGHTLVGPGLRLLLRGARA